MRTLTITLLLATTLATAQQPAQTPPMGWNSWDAYGLTITEQQFRDNVKVLHEKLQPFGYKYAVIDEGWFFFNPEDRPHPDKLVYAIDDHGRYVPVPARFPSSAPKPDSLITGTSVPPTSILLDTTFKPIADFVHAQGLLFGIHIVRGIPRVSVARNLPIADSNFWTPAAADQTDACPWDPTNWGVKDNPAGQAWYDSLLNQYADWGIDLLKVDCIADHPYALAEIRMIRRAIDKAVARTHRSIVLSLSPGPTSLDHAEELSKLANMTRISNDIWDVWSSTKDFPRTIKDQFALTAAWARYTRPGFFPDADMLPLGELRPSPGYGKPRSTQLTPDEQRTQLTLWAMARSPLILGANLTLLETPQAAPTLKLLTNRDLLAIDQTALSSSEIAHNGDLIVWRATLPGLKTATAIFNLADTPTTLGNLLTEADTHPPNHPPTDLWTNHPITPTTTIPPHGCLLLESR